MPDYKGYSGYDAESVKRQRSLADALMQRSMQSRGQPIESWTQGAAKLADAFFARQAGEQADQVQSDYKASQSKLGDAMIGQMFPDAAMVEAPLDLTPGGVAQTNAALKATAPTAAIGQQARQMAQYTGDPMAAVEFGLGQQDRALKLQDAELAREAARRKMNAPIEVSKGATLADSTSFKPLFTAPDLSAEGLPASGKVHSVVIDANGQPRAVMANADVRELGFTAQDNLGTLDIGGVPSLYSRRSGGIQNVTSAADAGQNKGTIAAGEALGKSQAEAIKNLPEITSSANRAIASIDELLNSKGFDAAYGIGRFNPLNMIPGSDAKNAEAIRGKLDGQFFVNAITAMQVSLAPVSDADALRLVASISQLTNPDISPEEARRVAGELKTYFQTAIAKATLATKRGPIGDGGVKQLAQISSDEEFARLPSGAEFIGPDGKKRRKP